VRERERERESGSMLNEKEAKQVGKKVRQVEGVAGRLKDFINALKALDRMHHHISQVLY
jgi:hypothetical protein